MSRARDERGFTLISVLLAVMMLTIGLVALARTQGLLTAAESGVSNRSVALAVATGYLEQLRGSDPSTLASEAPVAVDADGQPVRERAVPAIDRGHPRPAQPGAPPGHRGLPPLVDARPAGRPALPDGRHEHAPAPRARGLHPAGAHPGPHHRAGGARDVDGADRGHVAERARRHASRRRHPERALHRRDAPARRAGDRRRPVVLGGLRSARRVGGHHRDPAGALRAGGPRPVPAQPEQLPDRPMRSGLPRDPDGGRRARAVGRRSGPRAGEQHASADLRDGGGSGGGRVSGPVRRTCRRCCSTRRASRAWRSPRPARSSSGSPWSSTTGMPTDSCCGPPGSTRTSHPRARSSPRASQAFTARLVFVDGTEAAQADNGADGNAANDYDDIAALRVQATLHGDHTDPRVNGGRPIRRQLQWWFAPRNLIYERNRA